MSSSLPQEIRRRQSRAADVWALFEARPLVWISWQEIAKVGGECAWRTRIADARKMARKHGGNIEWNRCLSSQYRYVPYTPLGPSADQYRTQKGLF